MNKSSVVNSVSKAARKYEGYLYPLSFAITAVMINLQFFLGLMYEPNPVFTALNVLAAAICSLWTLYLLIRVWLEDRHGRKYLVMTAAVLLLYVTGYIIALVNYGLDESIRKQLSTFVLYGPFALFAGALIGLKRKEADFFRFAEVFCYLSLPLSVHYVALLLTNMNPYDNGGIGIVHYMQLSYAFMPMLFFMTVMVVMRDATRTNTHFKWVNALRAFCIIIYWLLILGTATRGTILGVLLFYGLYFVMLIVTKQRINRLVMVGSVVFTMFLLVTYAVDLPGLNRLTRMNELTSNLAEGELVSAEDAEAVQEVDLDTVVAADDAEDYGYVIGKTVKNRTTIFTLAWKEALKSPLTGMGPFGFTEKYGSYPHNFVLELLSELGLIIGGLALASILYCFIKLLLNCRRDPAMGIILVFLCGYLVQLMVSGTVWAKPVMMFGIGYSLCCRPRIRRRQPAEEDAAERSDGD